MPDLENRIAEWRRQMLAAGIKSPHPLEELESHLRDDIEAQIHAGISSDAAFDAAVIRLGSPRKLKPLFKGNDLDIRLVRPVYTRVLCFLAAPFLLSSIPTFFAANMSLAERYANVAVVSFTAFYLCSLPFFYRWFFSRNTTLTRLAVQFVYWFAVAWPIVAIAALLHIVPIGQVAGTICWSVFVGSVATFLAYANFERDNLATHTLKIAGS